MKTNVWHMEFIRILFKLMGIIFLALTIILIMIHDEDGMPGSSCVK